jgi:hypothetical protein
LTRQSQTTLRASPSKSSFSLCHHDKLPKPTTN